MYRPDDIKDYEPNDHVLEFHVANWDKLRNLMRQGMLYWHNHLQIPKELDALWNRRVDIRDLHRKMEVGKE